MQHLPLHTDQMFVLRNGKQILSLPRSLFFQSGLGLRDFEQKKQTNQKKFLDFFYYNFLVNLQKTMELIISNVLSLFLKKNR